MGKRKAKIKTTAPEVIVCPAWCERGDEHVTAEDTEHWINDRDATVGGSLRVSAVKDGGVILYEIASGDHVKINLQDDDVASLVGALVQLLADTHRDWSKRVTLPR